MLEEIMQYIRPELFILILFIWAVGLFLKKAPWFTQDWMIPFVLWGLAILFTILYVAVVLAEGFGAAVIIANIIQGTLIAAVAVFFNETVKQWTIKRKVDQT